MFNKYPYTDFHELNLDWIIAQIKQLHHDYDEFKALNTITNAGAWDITKQYQAWTVVSDNNAGYISFKAVPAGISITNSEYWGLIADYNILITNLASRISDLEAEDIIINSRLSALEKYNGSFRSKNIIFIGDSWTVGYTENTGDGYVECLQSMGLFKSVSKYCKGGCGYVTLADGINYNSLTDNMISDYSGHEEEANIIVYVGSVNDISVPDATIKSACESLFYKVRNAFPDAEIYAAATIIRGASYADWNRMEVPLDTARAYGIIPLYWPGRLLLGNAENFTSDGYHINHTLAICYANNIVNNLLGYFAYGTDPQYHTFFSNIDALSNQVTGFNYDDTYSGLTFNNELYAIRLSGVSFTAPTGGVEGLVTIKTNYMPKVASYITQLIDSVVNSRYAMDSTIGDLHTIKEKCQLESNSGVIRNPLYQTTFSGALSLGQCTFLYDRIKRCWLGSTPIVR